MAEVSVFEYRQLVYWRERQVDERSRTRKRSEHIDVTPNTGNLVYGTKQQVIEKSATTDVRYSQSPL